MIQVIKSRIRWSQHVAHIERERGTQGVLVWKAGKRPLGRPKSLRGI
jgi:hypothetical protein